MLCIEQAKHTESENLKAIVRLVVEFFAKKKMLIPRFLK